LPPRHPHEASKKACAAGSRYGKSQDRSNRLRLSVRFSCRAWASPYRPILHVRITPGTAGEPLVLPLGSGNSAQVLVRACGRPAATTSGSAGDSWAGRCLFRQRRDQQSNYHQHRAADCSGGLQAFSLKKFGRRGRARSASVCEFRKKSATQARICRSASFYSEVINAFVFRDSDYEQHLLG
jgi:hypothetical protein